MHDETTVDIWVAVGVMAVVAISPALIFAYVFL